MLSFYFTVRRFGEEHTTILTGERLTPEHHSPARFRLDDRSRDLTGMTEVEILHPEIVEDSPPINVFPARQEAEKQAPKVKPAPVSIPKIEPVDQLQMTLDFSKPEPAPEPAPEPVAAVAEVSDEDGEFLRLCRHLQIELYGEGWVRYRQEMRNV